MALLRRWKLVLAVVIGVLIAIYVLGYVLFSIGGTIPGSGEGDRVSLGSRP